MRLRRILSPGLTATLFQKRAKHVAATPYICFMPAKPARRFAKKFVAVGDTSESLPLKEGGAERRKIEWLAEPQLRHKRSSFFSVIPNLFRDPQIIENDAFILFDILLSQEIMRLWRILSPGLTATLFQKRAKHVAAAPYFIKLSAAHI